MRIDKKIRVEMVKLVEKILRLSVVIVWVKVEKCFEIDFHFVSLFDDNSL